MVRVFSVLKECCSVRSRSSRHRHILLTALVGIAVLLLPAIAKVVGDAGNQEVLKGITGVGVEVEDLPRMAEKLGIKKERLKAEVASRLRQAGIEVVSDDALKINPSLPFVKVSLIISYSKPTYIYAVVVGLNEKVLLERDPRIISYAMPWWRIVKGEHAGESALAGYVQETLRYIINEFIADHNKANAKEMNPDVTNSGHPEGAQREDAEKQSEKTGTK